MNIKVNKGFGKRVEMVRKDKGLSQVAFARMALSPNASAKNISRIEREEVTPRSITLEKIASFGGVDMEWLATGRCALKPNTICRTAGVGDRIRELRRKRGLTRNALARLAGLGNTPKNVARLETGEHLPRARTLVKLAAALRVSPVELAYGK